jgi:cytochrome P450
MTSCAVDDGFRALRAGAKRSEEDIYALYARLRSTAPFWRSPWGDIYLSSWALVDKVLTSRDFSHAFRPDAYGHEGAGAPFAQWLLFKDGADHALLRRTLQAPFLRDGGALSRCVVAIVEERLHSVPRNRAIDAVAWFTRAIPENVIARILGIPDTEMPQLRAWSEDIRTILDTGLDDSSEVRSTTARDFTDYFEAKLRRQAAGSITAGLFDVTELCEVIGMKAVAANLAFMAFAGHETTVHVLGSMLLQLSRDRTTWDAIREAPHWAPNLVSEALRLESPVQKICRCANRDLQLFGGHRLQRGDNVVLLVGAANRDPSRFRDPDRIDLARGQSAYLAFGTGAHACMGRGLAMIEGTTVLRWLAAHAGAITLNSYEWLTNSTFRGLSRLSVTLDD